MSGYQNDNWDVIYDPVNNIKKAFKSSKKNEDKLLQGVCLIGD